MKSTKFSPLKLSHVILCLWLHVCSVVCLCLCHTCGCMRVCVICMFMLLACVCLHTHMWVCQCVSVHTLLMCCTDCIYSSYKWWMRMLQVVERILFIHTKVHKGLGYIQVMNICNKHMSCTCLCVFLGYEWNMWSHLLYVCFSVRQRISRYIFYCFNAINGHTTMYRTCRSWCFFLLFINHDRNWW